MCLLQPTKDWLALWEKSHHKLECPVSLNEYFELPEIVEKKLGLLEMGTVSVPTGYMMVRDPLCGMDSKNDEPYFQRVPMGVFDVTACVVKPDDENDYPAYAAVRVKFTANKPIRFEEALTGNEYLKELGKDEFFGFGVDTGLACICDDSTRKAFCSFAQKWYEENETGDLYEDYFAPLFAESYAKCPKYQREGGDWINFTIPGTQYHIPIMQSGFGDGEYPVYFGYDEEEEICQLVVQFIDIELAYGKPSVFLNKKEFEYHCGFYQGKIQLDEWNDYFNTEDSYRIVLKETDTVQQDFTKQQKDAYDYVIQNQKHILNSILRKLIKIYPKWQKEHKFDEKDKGSVPDLCLKLDFAFILTPIAIHIYNRSYERIPYIGCEFQWGGDTAEGIGVILHGSNIVEIGRREIVQLRWKEEYDWKKERENEYL